MTRDPNKSEVDIEGLLEAVHGRTDEFRREQQVEAALKAIESTHRAASQAVRNFERHGRLQAEASVLAALGALADDSLAPSDADEAPAGAEPTAVSPAPCGAAEPTQVTARQPGAVPPAAAAAPEVTRQWQPSTEATAIYRPQVLSEEETAGGHASGQAAAGQSAAEVTRTNVAPLPAEPPPAAAARPPASPRAPAAEPAPVDDSMRPARVFSGRGKDVVHKEVTRTNVIRRPKG